MTLIGLLDFMQIDRRITNGLAWAGAALVVAIPAADYVSGALLKPAAPQLALMQEEPAPEPVVPAKPVAPMPKPAKAPEPALVAQAVAETSSGNRVSGGDAVEAYLQSGRKLPSYISDQPGAPAPVEAAPRPAIAVPADAAASQDTEVASLAPAKIAPVPMPLSMRPKSVERPPVAALPKAPAENPLIIEEPAPVVTATDLEDWESGPLADFLARRDQAGSGVPEEYDPDGFFLDQGPNSSARFQRFPRAYEDEGYYYIR